MQPRYTLKAAPSSYKPREYYKLMLGDEFGAVFDGVYQHWAQGWVRLDEIRKLFSDAEELELLNALTGGAFLGDVQQVLLDELMLCVTRLTDPCETGKHENLTVKKLPRFCNDKDLRSEASRLADRAVECSAPARKYRNQRISHIDLQTEIDPKARLLPRATLNEAKNALDAVHETLNIISLRLLRQHLANEVVTTHGAPRFMSIARRLARNIQFVDSLIDPKGTARVTDTNAANAFLEKLDQPLNWENTKKIIDLRESASFFKRGKE